VIHIIYRELPPSSNKIYHIGKYGQPVLKKEARTYAERFAHFMAVNHGHEFTQLNPVGVYELTLHFYLETAVNESWNNPKVTPSKRAESRYKKMDLSNRIKLIEDCVRDAIAIDDSHTFESHQKKAHDPANPRVEIFINEARPEWYGIPPRFYEHQPGDTDRRG
jgi:Holliday junction resolvase RusA-like endonuclease